MSLDLWAALHNEETVLGVYASLNVLGSTAKGLLHLPANVGKPLQQALTVARIRDQLQAMKPDRAGDVGPCADGLEEASTGKALQIFAVAVGAEDEALLCAQPSALAEEGADHWGLALLTSEAECAPGEVPDERLPATRNHLPVDLVRIVGERVLGVEDKGVLGGQQLLHQHCHVQVMETATCLCQRHPRPQAKEGGPDLPNGFPCLGFVKELTEAALPVLVPYPLHGADQRFGEIAWHRELSHQALRLLEYTLSIVVARRRLQPLQRLLELREPMLAIGVLVCQDLLHATVGHGHRLWRPHVAREQRSQLCQVQALGANLGAIHLVRHYAPLAAQVVGQVHVHKLGILGLELETLLCEVAAHGTRPLAQLLGARLRAWRPLDGERAVSHAKDLDPLAHKLAFDLSHHIGVEACREQHLGVARTNRAVGEDIRSGSSVPHQDCLDADRNLLFPTHSATQEHRRRFEDLVLHVKHALDDLQLPLHWTVHRRNHLPRRELRDAP
mmetsp:Transcript_82732/g.192222  ORF Transcript_82732/g.192222 Transcript_82732/m.192222 type:complete len:502 (+) Transcript_82732:283-1788(+)